MKRELQCTAFAILFRILPMTAMASGPAPEFGVSRTGIQEAAATNIGRVTIEETFQSNFRTGQGNDGTGRDNNAADTWHYELFYSHRVPLNGPWQLRLGLDLDRRDFGDNRSLAPNMLQSYAGVVGLEYSPGGQSRFFIESHPGLYMVHDLRTKTFDAPTILGGVIPLVDGKLSLALGVSISTLRSYPVLPIGGIIWHINDAWDLEACLPNPRIFYKATENLQVWAGGQLTGGAYRIDGSTNPTLNGGLNEATVTYYEMRAGAGVIYTGWKRLAVDAGAGWTFERKFDLHRVPAVAATEGAPYARVIFSLAF